MLDFIIQKHMGPLLVQLDHVGYHIDHHKVISDISFSIYAGQTISLIGYNGSGKSTLLKLIVGAIAPTSGTIIKSDNIRIGYMPQSTSMRRILPITVYDFFAIYGISGSLLTGVMEEYQLQEIMDRPLHGLSGGQLQRVLIAQATAHKPDLILMDEPTAGLDIAAQKEFYQIMDKLVEGNDCSLVVVSHDIHTVYARSDLVVCLHDGICCAGHPSEQHISDDVRRLFGEHILPYHHHHHD